MSDEIEDKTAAPQAVSAKKAVKLSSMNIGILCAAFSVVVLILVGSYSYWCLLINDMQLAHLIGQSQAQLQQLQESSSEMQKNVDTVQQRVQQYADEIKNLKQTVNDLSQVKQNNQGKWLLAEAHYYVKQANDVLQFSTNISLAVTLLKLADQEISHISDSKLTEVRRVIAADIANLQGATQVDQAGIYARLTAVNNQLDQLPLLATQPDHSTQKPAAVAEQKQTWWQRALYAVEQALQKIVIVRYNPNGLEPVVLPAQQILIYQNLHMLLNQAVWALLNKQPAIYQSSLQQAIASIRRYFIIETPITQNVLSDLTQLEKIEIYSPVPTITNTLQAFNGIERV